MANRTKAGALAELELSLARAESEGGVRGLRFRRGMAVRADDDHSELRFDDLKESDAQPWRAPVAPPPPPERASTELTPRSPLGAEHSAPNAEAIAALVEKMELVARAGGPELKMSLGESRFGQAVVEVGRVAPGMVAVRLRGRNAAARRHLGAHLKDIRAALRDRGLAIASLVIG